MRDTACLVGICVEVCGVVARALGRNFVSHPRLLPAVLAPLLEMLGDTDEEV